MLNDFEDRQRTSARRSRPSPAAQYVIGAVATLAIVALLISTASAIFG